MYHRFNENKYPSTNIKMNVFQEQMKIIRKLNYKFYDPKLLIEKFNSNKIQFGFHYPYPLHKLEFAKKYFNKEKYHNSEQLANYGISIPIDPNLKINEINKICRIINSL